MRWSRYRKVDVKEKGVNKRRYSHQKQGTNLIERRQQNAVKATMKMWKLRRDVNLKGALKKRRKTNGRKAGGLFPCIAFHSSRR